MSWQFESRFLVVFPVLCVYWGVMDQQFMSGTAVLGGLLIGLSSCCSEWFRAWKSEAGAASTGEAWLHSPTANHARAVLTEVAETEQEWINSREG